ncbi:hypothetical protein PtA15_7A669 [Puccinia triticina]|uniref:PI-PLC Y-box domain-containing protein n=1 Tax=Puccinia triticina TaxID=208348 RepID=A0ABY7CQI5_9BASI|nr:uncharacterized protein PtA15_7A669 [Puccinia triticina]WAQ86940.1 hypothetical protein PtA15_7A669 [Puccinia triticina]
MCHPADPATITTPASTRSTDGKIFEYELFVRVQKNGQSDSKMMRMLSKAPRKHHISSSNSNPVVTYPNGSQLVAIEQLEPQREKTVDFTRHPGGRYSDIIKTFKTIIAPSANKSMDGLLDILKSTAKANHSIDFCDLFFRFTMDSFVQMTFGKDLGLLGTDYYDKGEASSPSKLSPVSIPFADAFDFAQDQIDFRFLAVRGWQLIKKLVGSIGKRMKALCCVLDDYAYSLIDERMASLAQSSDCGKK